MSRIRCGNSSRVAAEVHPGVGLANWESPRRAAFTESEEVARVSDFLPVASVGRPVQGQVYNTLLTAGAVAWSLGTFGPG
jgi:hypothetical protein